MNDGATTVNDMIQTDETALVVQSETPPMVQHAPQSEASAIMALIGGAP